ncbi:MAG: glycosyltransferase [Chloroflexota bacterium]|nr:MAG: glycosyltransferase [Chloroflexota bacterium]
MARIVFLDRIPWDYRVDTPGLRPLGGSQSALCYLAQALAELGHEVETVTHTSQPGRIDGVLCRSAPKTGFEVFHQADAVVVLNDPDLAVARAIRAAVGPKGLVLLWTQHDTDQPAMAPFADPDVRAAWDKVVLVSEWQRQAYGRSFGLALEKGVVLANAVAPAFARIFAEGEDVLAAKSGPPVLAYTSTPFRGLDVLLQAFPLIRRRRPEARLLVHSSLGVYQVARSDDAYLGLYERAAAMPGVDYAGSVPQPALAAALRRTLCFAYPSTFPETFCISALEAMAAGCLAVLGDLGALSETTLGLAELVEPDPDPEVYAERFADRLVQVLESADADPKALARRLEGQVRHLSERATWPKRAAEWSRWIAAERAARA